MMLTANSHAPFLSDTDTDTDTDTDVDATPRAVRPVSMAVVADDAWETAVADFDGVCQEQLLTFAKNRWPSVRHEPVVFSTGGRVVGGSLVMIQQLPLRLGGIAVSKWAPMLRDARHPDAMALYAGMVEALIGEYAQRRRMMLSVLPRMVADPELPEMEYLLDRGFRLGAGLRFPDRYIVKLRLSDDEQRRSLEQKWRYHLNKSEKAGLSFERAGFERAGEFHALYELMIDRKKFTDYSAYHTAPALLAIQNETLRPELFFVRHEGRVIAGAIVFTGGDRAVYLYGATAPEALALRAGYFMQWQVFRWLRDNTRAEWYDLGGTDGFQGLHQFKKGMVGSAGVITPAPRMANYAAYRLPLLLGEGAFAVRELLQTVQRAIGGLRTRQPRPADVRQERRAVGSG
jgi:hypothetical protein